MSNAPTLHSQSTAFAAAAGMRVRASLKNARLTGVARRAFAHPIDRRVTR